jgi:hypothetical protein
MARLSHNAWGAVGIAVGTLIYLFEARKLPFGSVRNPDIGFMPILIGFLVLGLCLVLLAGELLRPPKERQEEVDLFNEEDKEESAGLKKPMLLAGVILVYPLAFLSLGFLLATVLLTTASLRVMEYRGWFGSFGIAVVITLAAYLLFGSWLHVNFPKGILG